jgi:uncharacterized protein (TIGR02646 family)
MRNITKRPEPPTLTAWRATNPTDFDGYQDKDTLRDSLAAEQRAICCYCQSRIRPEIGSMKIEHWASHSGHLNLRLVYSNLLGACMGREGKPGRDQHCDTYKGDKDLCRNPAEPAHDVEAVLHYLIDGRMASSNELFNEQLNSVLNLNHPFLMNARKQELNSLKELLRIRGGALSRRQWERLIEERSGANDNGNLRPYCNVVLYWARRHLARLPQ